MIKKAITYFLVLTATLYLLRFLHYQGLLKQNKGYYAKLKTAFVEKNNFNVLFLGSSRAEMHYNTKLFDSITGQNAFNLGLSGAMPHVAFAALKAYLANSHAPKYLLYEVDYHILKFKLLPISDFNNFFPFLSNPVLRREFNQLDGRMNQFYYNPYYSLPFTGLKNISTGLHGWLNKANPTDNLYEKGFFSENFENHLAYVAAKPVHIFIHPFNRQYLDSIIGICKRNNIHLSFITSPIFAGGMVEMINPEAGTKQVSDIAGRNHIPYFNLSSRVYCKDRRYFLDYQHMKSQGARLFTIELADIFNNKIATKPLKVK